MDQIYNIKININKELSLKRLDKVLSYKIQDISRTKIKMLIQNGNVKKNNVIYKDPSYLVKEGEIFKISALKEKQIIFEPEDIDLDIFYEDEECLVVNKSAGMVTHPAPGNNTGTLVHALLNHTKNHLSGINGIIRPGIVHRLDKDTSGLIVIAKNDHMHNELAKQFKLHTINRKYHAIVWGFPKNQIIEGYVERNKINRKKMSLNKKGSGKYSKTKILVKKNYGNSSLIECELFTGRTHQVRLHMKSINCPLVGDKLYGKSKIDQYTKDKKNLSKSMILKNFNRHALHAFHLSFYHPKKKKILKFNSSLPRDMSDLLKFLLKY
ncbi:MAG: RNA pseudouridine synthase [Pelagibacteraceae bacterium]|nr:RNA pseudouridine synthase [Pelagibacteraceae bacterium]|tara:strand:- start:28603 stop:29574 length:972 start_codon:yes stop_codon:yes gene_type:complete